MTPGMRIEPPMNNHRGEYGSPHVSMPMKGDLTKIDALVQNDRAAAAGGGGELDRTEKESRDTGDSSPAGSAKAKSVEGADQSDGGYQPGGPSSPSSPMSPQTPYPGKESTPDAVYAVSPDPPLAPQTDAIFREPQGPASWSNVVSSNVPSSPLGGMATRSSSGETLLTSNTSQLHTNLHHLGLGSARSHSFGTETPPRSNLPKSHSFGADANSYQQSGLGFPPSHPGHSSFQDSTLPALNQGAAHPSPLMYPSTPYQEFKPRPSVGSYSPISLGGDSMTTDQTSPMSSPSLSPHVSPAMHPRKRDGDAGGPPPMWHLSDSAAECSHATEPSSPRLRLHSHLPQSIPEHHRHEPDDPAHYGHRAAYMTGPPSPPRHPHPQSSAGSHQHHSVYPRRPGPKPYGAGPPSHAALHHRSSTEVLKTLLRKKACLYEPETSLAVSLVTWLVGRRLALSQGYFTRQQLQAGVHSCVAGKIREGHVTRTKVNRCMQVILNSCFHYIIPRPDGSEECGEAFRAAFAREAADEERLLGTLPAPWNGLNLLCMADEESHSSLFHDSDDDHPAGKAPGKESSSGASQAGDSLDSGKRSVLLCFNENIRCASDVFRCHNEFIRDVAHTGNLILSPEEWRSFFSGTSAYRRRGGGGAADAFQSGGFHLADMHDRMDRRGLSNFRTSWCAKRYDHDRSFCAFAHVDVNRGWLRRDPFVYSYRPVMCPHVKPLPDARDCYVNMCPLGVRCDRAHSREEVLYHPEAYKRQPCRSAPGTCPLGDICPHVHAEASSSSHQSHGYGRREARRYHDHPSPYGRSSNAAKGGNRRASASGGQAAGFGRLPDGSPMLYVDPAPLSAFEETLGLPGLQALFRDHSASVFYSTLGGSTPCEYGPFGYRTARRERTPESSTGGPIGSPTRR